MNEKIEKLIAELGEAQRVSAAAFRRKEAADSELAESHAAFGAACQNETKARNALTRAIYVQEVGPIEDGFGWR